VTLWGFAFGALPVAVQTWMVRAAPDHAESTGGLIVATFQVGIASGAVLGGLFVDSFGPLGAITYCAVATLASGLYVMASRRSIAF
jgi:predicted MFS family arabinose efflux permease